MADEENEERGFTVVDRRGASDDAADSAAKAGGETGAPSPPPAASADALPPVDLPGFIVSLGTSALFHLGLVADPATGQPGAPNLNLARHTIDTIELLHEKTQGNLTADEEKLFQDLLTELRMRFVEVSQASK